MKSWLPRTALRRVLSFTVEIECETCGTVRSFTGYRLDETCELIHKAGWSGGQCQACKTSLYRCSLASNVS